jgi:tetratricopeptide (TPR) repeat protein
MIGLMRVCKRVVAEQRRMTAVDCWERAVKAFPDEPLIRQRAADAALHIGDGARAMALLAPLVDARAADGHTIRLLAAAVARTDGLEAGYARAEALRPEVKSLTFHLDWWMLNAAQRLGRFGEAQEALKRARRGASQKQRRKLDKQEAQLLEQLGNKTEALIRRRRIADANPRDPSALYEQARLELDLGLTTQAELTLRKLERNAPEHRGLEVLRRRVTGKQDGSRPTTQPTPGEAP